MDFNTEIEFVKKYIKKEYQERLIFELQSQKHREKAISRFSHFSKDILNDSFKSCDMSEFPNLVRDKIAAKEKTYIISSDENDGKLLPLSEAVECCKKSYMAMILISKKFVLVKEEYEKRVYFFFQNKKANH